ncbi:penicillin-binding protein activator [Sinirhodobacter populi]|uniref:Penicillin-binding protein activator n=2 Tax=Paenirhodobacter populi TaxID=2306993 RepID=A0A443K7Z0_9RHOB|nr:penicillin-binding protein activator [Sinirhodobacter populi]
MFARLRSSRNPLSRSPFRIRMPGVVAALSALWLAACEPTGAGRGASGPSIDTSAAVPVALLLPGGSGNTGDETLARSLRQAAELAVADLDGVRIDLRVYNTGASPQQAAAIASQAVDEGAKIILGPVFAQSANAAGAAVASRGINVLSFSNNADVAGGNVFVLGQTFANTANRLASYAVAQGKRNILVVNEQTTAGEIGANAISAAITRAGAAVAGRESYPFSQQGVTQAGPRIAARANGGGVDAMFLTADSAGALPMLAQVLSEQGVSPSTTQYIGLTRWDIPPATLSLPGLQGGWFALPDPGMASRFSARYQAAYGSTPNPIAGLAYDGIAAIGALVKSGRADALTKPALTQSSGFVGVNGIFRLRADGTSERALAIAEVRNGQAAVIDPAPRSFSGAGY